MENSRKDDLMVLRIFFYTLSIFLSYNTPVYSKDVRSYITYDQLVSRYDILVTLAGTGEIKSGNGWKSQYEGAPGLQVELSRPHHALADGTGRIYIADKEAHAIRAIELDGTITTVAGTSRAGDGVDFGPATEIDLFLPNGLWVKENGIFYVLDTGNDKVRKVGRDGNMTTMFYDPDGTCFGRGLWVSPDEKTVLYAACWQLKKWTHDKGIEVLSDNFDELANFVVTKSGDILATSQGEHLVYRIKPDGRKWVIAGNGTPTGGGHGFPAKETGLFEVRGVWEHPEGGYFLATHKGSQIWYVDMDGIIHLFLNGKHKGHPHTGDNEHFQTPGFKISEPRAVAMDFQGNIIVTENDYGYIRLIKKRN